LEKAFRIFRRRKACSPPDAGDIGQSKGPPMQATPTLKETDPHDVFAIESLLHAHAEKAPPLAHDPAIPPAAPEVQVAAKPQIEVAAKPQIEVAAKPQVHVTPPISAGAPTLQVEPTFSTPGTRDIRLENVRPSEIKVDGLKPPGAQPMSKWVKRAVLALLGLCSATAAAAWQHYGDQATAMAAEWAPPFVLAALPSATRPAIAEQPSAPAAEAAAPDQATAQQPAAAAPAQPAPAATAASAPSASAESNQLQSMAQDLATMGQQVEELKATIAQLKASQAQMSRELAKASEAKAGETRPAEQNLRPKVSALAPPPQRPAAPPPARKPKPAAYSYPPAYSSAPAAAAPVTAAPAALLPPAQAAAPLPPAPPRQTIADDGEPVVRPPMPLR
jgi:chemotaxis protein histidine kinase CheA